MTNYLVIGNGRVASHFRYYLQLLNLPFAAWQRSESIAKFKLQKDKATHILLLISDAAIEPFLKAYLNKHHGIPIHFSGSVVTNHAIGAHPLMTFTHQLYTFKKYQAIPFVIDDDAPAFSELLPGFPNPHVRLEKKLKAKYHAMCVLAANFSCILWQKFFSSFENEFNFSPEMAFPFLQQQMLNLQTNYQSALTGPLARDDKTTIEKNLAALTDDPFQEIYQSFVNCYAKLK